MKRKTLVLLFIVMILLLVTACTDDADIDFSDVDYASSVYKHINNGGITDANGLPYNVDAITSATLTVEGPGVVVSIPLSVRELENRTEGLSRGIYSDKSGKYIYEGIDLAYVLKDMVDGDNGIILTDKAYLVDLKNSNRETIATFTLDDVNKASEDGRPILLAYGKGTTDGEIAAPFVFNAASDSENSLGYIAKLKNDDGCLRLVYDLKSYGDNKDYKSYDNVAYVYVREASEPGFKHTQESGEAYSASKLSDYIISFRGDALGYEMDFTVEQLEALAVYDKDGQLIDGGIGYSDYYSLANTTYWYVNEYEGLDLYKLLMYLGMDSAEDMGTAKARTTLVSFLAADGVAAAESFSVDTLSYPDAFGFYKKNAADMGDGSYKPTNADLVKTGYPVLLAYGVNNYPYTIGKTDDGYLSGLANNGGPMRVVFGKTQYNHANGSNQVQYLSDVVVGNNVYYNTHKYTDNTEQSALSDSKLSIHVYDEDGKTLSDTSMTVGGIEDLIYGEDVQGGTVKSAKVKDTYEITENGEQTCAVFEGVNLEYLLMEVIGLPGTNGTVTFSDGTRELTVTMADLFAKGYNTSLDREGLTSLLAFSKNGSPMVSTEKSKGYVKELSLTPYLDSDPSSYTVDNDGGPLAVIVPSSDESTCNAQSIMNVTSITVNLEPDAYAHTDEPYSKSADSTVRIYGEGLNAEKVYSVSDLESMQTRAVTWDYSMLTKDGTLTQARYRGVPIYELFTDIGIKNNAGDVTVYADDGTSVTFSLSQLKKQTFLNYVSPSQEPLAAILAYGSGKVDQDIMDGKPLVTDTSSSGYDSAYENDGGPLKLIMPQESKDTANSGLCVKNVTAIEVSANDIETWGHAMSDMYSEFLDYTFTLTIRNDDSEWTHDFTVEQIESLPGIRVRDEYSVLDLGECEGIDIWKFVQLIAGDVPGIDDPVSVTAYATDGYKNDLLSVFYMDGLVNGVEDENGDRKPLILAYAVNGCPLVDSESHEGYTGLAKNADGPLRIVAETNQGASVKYASKLVVTIPGSGKINVTVDNSIFQIGK
jgi:DMSO/TMAO reductase YedYZ molybdopterin-dependent catalytic subunit